MQLLSVLQAAAWLNFSPTAGKMVLNALLLVILLVSVLAILPLTRDGIDISNRFLCGLVAVAPLLPLPVAQLATTAIYVLPIQGSAWHRPHQVALLFGILVGLVAWVAWAACAGGRSTAAGQNTRSYAELWARCASLEASYTSVSNPLRLADAELEAWTVIREGLDFVEAELGILSLHHEGGAGTSRSIPRPSEIDGKGREVGQGGAKEPAPPVGLRWVLATGYINLWGRLHRAEEALIAVQPRTALVQGALRDEVRLEASAVPNLPLLLGRLRWAIGVLEPSASKTSGAADESRSEWEVTEVGAPISSSTPVSSEESAAPAPRVVLTQVRRSIHEYSEGLWESLVRARNGIGQSVIHVQLISFLLLGLFILVNGPRHVLLAAFVFYLVGGVAGLSMRFLTRGFAATGVEDYGYRYASLIQSLVFCGLTAIAGVFVTDVLLDPAFSWVLSPAGHGGGPGRLNQIFSVPNDPGGLIIAVAFGLLAEVVIIWSARPVRRCCERLGRLQANPEGMVLTAGGSPAPRNP